MAFACQFLLASNGYDRNCRGLLVVFVIILSSVHLDIVELEGVDSLAGGDDSKPVSELVLLQELLGEILEVSAGEGGVGDNKDLALVPGDLDSLTKVSSSSVDLDSVVQELFESSTGSVRR